MEGSLKTEDASRMRCNTVAILKMQQVRPELFTNLFFGETWMIDNIHRYISYGRNKTEKYYYHGLSSRNYEQLQSTCRLILLG